MQEYELIRLIRSENEWKKFIEMTRYNFSEHIDKVIDEGIEYHQKKG